MLLKIPLFDARLPAVARLFLRCCPGLETRKTLESHGLDPYQNKCTIFYPERKFSGWGLGSATLGE